MVVVVQSSEDIFVRCGGVRILDYSCLVIGCFATNGVEMKMKRELNLMSGFLGDSSVRSASAMTVGGEHLEQLYTTEQSYSPQYWTPLSIRFLMYLCGWL